MIEKVLCAALGLILGQGACPAPGSRELTRCQRAAIADTVEQVVADWFEAYVELDAGTRARYLSDDFIFAGDGGYLSTDRDGRAWSGSLDSFEAATGTLEIEDIEILGRDAAVLSWRVDVHWTMMDHRVTHHVGLTTAVVARRGGVWKIIRQHESRIRP